jgi:hypothetical protein
MSVSAIANINGAAFAQADAQSQSSNASTSNSAASVTAASQATAETTESESSTQVVLSASAQVLANFNADGITVGEVSLASLNLPSQSAPDYMELAMQATSRLGPPTNSKGRDDGAISQSSFEAVIKQFGGTKAQADQLFASFDTDGNGSISNSELLTGMSKTGSDPASSSSQSLLKLMDTDNGGTVNTVEFSSFEGAMVAAEKAPAQ